MKHRLTQYTKAFLTVLALVLATSGCTKKRDAALPESEAEDIFAISEFSSPVSSGLNTSLKPSTRVDSDSLRVGSALLEKGRMAVDMDSSAIPSRLKFMFSNFEVSGRDTSAIKIVFGVDSKFVTAYKLTTDLDSLTKIERQLAVSAEEVQFAIEIQKATDDSNRKMLIQKLIGTQKNRINSLKNKASINILVPLFKYEILEKGVLAASKNELREETSTLTLKETEFSKATHIKIKINSEDRKDIAGIEQKKELDQLYTIESMDNVLSTAAEVQSRFNFHMKFVPDDTKVLTKLDAEDLKVFEVTNTSKLSLDEARQFKTERGNGELIPCAGLIENEQLKSEDKGCVLRLVAKVPVTYKNVALNLADSKENTTNTLELTKVQKSEADGLVEIESQVQAERARPTGIIDPLHTIRISDLKGEFYFRRTFEEASNMMVVGKTGTSGDMSVVQFEFENNRLVVRNQKALLEYLGQGPKDKEELMSVPVKYFALERKNAAGVALQIPKLIESRKEDAEYIEIDWTQNSIPIANSPLAFFDAGQCWHSETSQKVTDMDMRLEKDGMLNFSLAGSYTVRPDCANQNAAIERAQFNFNVIERISFKKRINSDNEDRQFAPNISLNAQSAMNFAIFTMSDQNNDPNVRAGRENSLINRPIIHDFRNGKVLTYWVGGLANSSAQRRALIESAAKDVVGEWNEAFHKVFANTELARSGDYIVLNTENESNRGHLGDLDRNYLWFMDMPAENGLLGVAQFAPNPYSGTIVANNVIVYSGNSETEVRGFMETYKESREYEKLLEKLKAETTENFKKELAAQGKMDMSPTNSTGKTASTAEKVSGLLRGHDNYIKKLILSAQVPTLERMSSKYSSALAAAKTQTQINLNLIKNSLNNRSLVSDIKLTSNKDFTRRILQEALNEDLKNDPGMLEAIIARELARTNPGFSPQVKAVLMEQARMKELSAKFDRAAKKRGGCFMYSRNDFNDAFLAADFDTLFKKEIKATLSHEIGHALGLRHNFKGSYDKANFNAEGENYNRNYTSIMDYLASPEMAYRGPGPYDVHALKAIYTGLIELSDKFKKIAKDSGGVLSSNMNSNFKASVVGEKYIKLEDVKSLFGFKYWTQMQKAFVDSSGLLKHYGQCHDELVGIEPACEPYDQGDSATEIVKSEIQNYYRSYATNYRAGDRLNFGISQKISVIRRSIEKFRKIRGVLDQFFKLAFKGTEANRAEIIDFRQASQLGYEFFHELIRTPDTSLGFGNSEEEIKQRLIPSLYTLKKPVLNSDGSPMKDSNGGIKFETSNEVKILEARSTQDVFASGAESRFDTLGINYDKQFALNFLMKATPAGLSDEEKAGSYSYNDYEKMVLGVSHPANSTNMMTLLEIMMNTLKVGFVDPYHNLQLTEKASYITRGLLDTAMLTAIGENNEVRTPGLDLFAEFYKIGVLKGGKTVSDRATVGRYGQNSSSAVGVRFYATDNAKGADLLIKTAARKGILIDNKSNIEKKMIELLKADMQLNDKAAMLTQKNPDLKGKSLTDLVQTNAELKTISAGGDKIAAELSSYLNSLNTGELLVSKAELASNPNLALETQVLMARGMMVKSMSLILNLGDLISSDKNALFEEMKPFIRREKISNDALAKLDLLALAQEVVLGEADKFDFKLSKGGTLAGSEIAKTIMEEKRFTTSQENLMYVIEELARYTSQINPEYIY